MTTRLFGIAVVGAALLAGCSPVSSTSAPASPQATVPSAAPTLAAKPTVLPTADAGTGPTARCSRAGATAMQGVVELRPAGWFDRTPDGAEITDAPDTDARIYGPTPVEDPPWEGPGRLVLYETFPASDAYFRSRVDLAREAGATAVTVSVCSEATEVWVNEASGELVLGWRDRDKSDVLVGNTADFTVDELVASAESVSDCCG